MRKTIYLTYLLSVFSLLPSYGGSNEKITVSGETSSVEVHPSAVAAITVNPLTGIMDMLSRHANSFFLLLPFKCPLFMVMERGSSGITYCECVSPRMVKETGNRLSVR